MPGEALSGFSNVFCFFLFFSLFLLQVSFLNRKCFYRTPWKKELILCLIGKNLEKSYFSFFVKIRVHFIPFLKIRVKIFLNSRMNDEHSTWHIADVTKHLFPLLHPLSI